MGQQRYPRTIDLEDIAVGRVTLSRVVEVAHRYLDFDGVCISEIADGQAVCRAVAGPFALELVQVGDVLPAESSLGWQLVHGRIPAVIPDARASVLTGLGKPDGPTIGAFIGVPLRLRDSSLYGSLCAVNGEPVPALSERDLRFLSMLGEIVIDELEEQRRLETLRRDLLTLIDGGSVSMAAQPVIELRSGHCLGVETLARFPGPFNEPEAAFAAAKSVGLDYELERLCVIGAWGLLPLLGPRQVLSFNLSPDTLVELARRNQHRLELPWHQLVIEITEHAAVSRYEELRDLLAPFRAKGLRIAIDDAGAGYASFHHIVELRPDYIKIDRSLVDRVATDHARRVAISAFVMLALDLNATTVAEGVESADDLTTLGEIGIDAAQGFLLGRPSTDRETVERWLKVDNAESQAALGHT